MMKAFVGQASISLNRSRRSTARWTCKLPLGALPGDPNAKRYKISVKDPRNGQIYTAEVPEDRYIYFYMTEQGMDLPAQCRNGCCTTCAVKLSKGEVHQPEALGLLKEMKDRGYALMCVSYPRSDIEAVLQDEDEVYVQQFGSTFESGGVEFGGVLPEED
mmetsp:Transcript_1292/g.3943  ORF Transcript_1292/g.3943 Transcript_1292/m.3943 type:complete len:160 (+) Transcript_1292:63-542(+)